METAAPPDPAPGAAFAEAGRLGVALSRTFDLVHPSRWSAGPLAPSEVFALAGEAAFRRPLERVLAAALDRSRLDLEERSLAAPASQAPARLARLLVCEPRQTIEPVALSSAAVALQKQVLRVALKPMRERLRAAFGASAFLVATQEAPTLHPSLAALAPEGALDAIVVSDEAEENRRRLTDWGLALLLAFVEATEPRLAGAMAARLPLAPAAAATPGAFGPHLPAFTRFVRRRHPEWSDHIG
ncbi:hypothetical protein [Antarcticirhabdus aurantiaca]|uniref:Uncharacterized protein n=1 Tax=Antarcticirhabdus aurantiaca TaxID=2606717 RepID=A0ACD4NUG4_9HYPH|nr:hypothetical protein [Antarcticirhabdus aurantiaca]WAJ30517.1 hypothetical protein OXU80_10060 [Jeongeuplla avenae]